jgi:glutamyl-tRNA reductase
MNVAIIGTNHMFGDVEYRERWALASRDLLRKAKDIPGFSCVFLFSCNRSEIYFHSSDLVQTVCWLEENLKKQLGNDFSGKNYLYTGKKCFLHLSSVSSGLDSAQIGETDIRRQVREAYKKAQEEGPLCRELHFLFQKSLKIAKQVATRISAFMMHPSLEQIIFDHFLQTFGSSSKKKIFFLGNSQMTRKMIHYLTSKVSWEFTICSKTKTSFSDLSSVKIVDYSQLSTWKDYDVVFCATNQDSHVLATWDHAACTRLICDLSVPRSVSPDMLIPDGVHLLNMDYFNEQLKKNHSLYGCQIHELKVYIEILVDRYCAIFIEKMRYLQTLQGANFNGCCISL